MRNVLIPSVALLLACSSEPDPVEACNEAKSEAMSAWGTAHEAALAFKEGPEAEEDKKAQAVAQEEAKKAEGSAAATRHIPMGRGGSIARGSTRASASAKKGAARSATAQVARYDQLIDAAQSAKDKALADTQDAWDATIAGREAMERFWVPPEAPPSPYAEALAAGEAAWQACSTLPAK